MKTRPGIKSLSALSSEQIQELRLDCKKYKNIWSLKFWFCEVGRLNKGGDGTRFNRRLNI